VFAAMFYRLWRVRDAARPGHSDPRMMVARLIVHALVVAIVTPAIAAQPDGALSRKFDSIATANLAQDRAVGAVVAVVKDNEVLFFKPYGKFDVEANVPMRPDAIFGIGSITKQFTAAAILRLRDQGKLSLDDDLTKWLPDFPARGNKVPLHRLLDHTSGIPDVTTRPGFGQIVRNATAPREAMYEAIKRYPFDFPTGTAQIYSNSAYWLLYLVIEKASGMSYGRYLETELFAPLGMQSTSLCLSIENVPRRAPGYRVRNGKIRRMPLNVTSAYLGSGALCSSAGDMVTWLNALHGGKVLSPASYAEMIAPATLLDGTPTRYATGLEVRRDPRGNHYLGHSGELPGYAARANWYPEARMAIVVLMNNSGDASPSTMAADLAAEVLPGTDQPSKPFTGDAASLEGSYKGRSRDGEMVVTVRQKREGLAVSVNGSPARIAEWVEGLTFRDGGAFLTFRRAGGDSGPVTQLRYDAGTGYYILERMERSAAMLTQTVHIARRFWLLLFLAVVATGCVFLYGLFRWWRRRRLT
jgi:D-alanyl-D-alanine carboxypeptidase